MFNMSLSTVADAFVSVANKCCVDLRTGLLKLFLVSFSLIPLMALADDCNVLSSSVVFSSNELSRDAVAQRDVSVRVECNDSNITWGLKTTPTPFYIGNGKDEFYAVFYQKNQAIVDDESAMAGMGSQEVIMRLFLGHVKDKSVAIMGPGFFEPIRTAGVFAFPVPVILTYGPKSQMSQNSVNVSGLVPTTCVFGTISRVTFDQVRIGMIPRQSVTIPLSCDTDSVNVKLSSTPALLTGLPDHVAAIYENSNSISFLGANDKQMNLVTGEAQSWIYQNMEVRIGTGSLANGVVGPINQLGTFSGSIPITASW